MFNPLTRLPLPLKKMFRLASLKIPNYIGMYKDSKKFNIYIQSAEQSQNGKQIKGFIDDGKGIMKFDGTRNPSKLELSATYYQSCVRKSQTPRTFMFEATGEEIFKGTATSKDLLTYNFGTGY